MSEFAYVVMVFMLPVSSDPFQTGTSQASFGTLEACVEAMPAVLADEFAHIEDAIRGAACVRVDAAEAIREARSRLYQ